MKKIFTFGKFFTWITQRVLIITIELYDKDASEEEIFDEIKDIIKKK